MSVWLHLALPDGQCLCAWLHLASPDVSVERGAASRINSLILYMYGPWRQFRFYNCIKCDRLHTKNMLWEKEAKTEKGYVGELYAYWGLVTSLRLILKGAMDLTKGPTIMEVIHSHPSVKLAFGTDDDNDDLDEFTITICEHITTSLHARLLASRRP